MFLSNDVELGKEISKIRVSEGLSLQGMADKIPGESKQSYYKKEIGLTRLKVEDIKDISSVLPVSVSIERGSIILNKLEEKVVDNMLNINKVKEVCERYSVVEIYMCRSNSESRVYITKEELEKDSTNRFVGIAYGIYDNIWNSWVNDLEIFETVEEAVAAVNDIYSKKIKDFEYFEDVYALTENDKKNILSVISYRQLFRKITGDYFYFDMNDIRSEFEELYKEMPSSMDIPSDIERKYNLNCKALIEMDADLTCKKWNNFIDKIEEDDMLRIIKNSGYLIKLDSGSTVFFWRYLNENEMINEFIKEYELDVNQFWEVKSIIEGMLGGRSIIYKECMEYIENNCSFWTIKDLTDYLNQDGDKLTCEDILAMPNVFKIKDNLYMYVS